MRGGRAADENFPQKHPSQSSALWFPTTPISEEGVGEAQELAHVMKELTGFFAFDMLQLFEFKRFLFDHVIARDGEGL
jgi:hypothetical protein